MVRSERGWKGGSDAALADAALAGAGAAIGDEVAMAGAALAGGALVFLSADPSAGCSAALDAVVEPCGNTDPMLGDLNCSSCFTCADVLLSAMFRRSLFGY